MIPALLALLPLAFAADADGAAPSPTHLRTRIVVQVADVEDARDALVQQAEGAGGWFAGLTDRSVSLRVPLARADGVESFARTLGTVVDRDYQREDLTAQLRDQRSALGARERTLERYLTVLADADAKSIVAVQREINRLVQEIEGYEGRIRYLEHAAAMAEVDVDFQFRDRQRPAPSDLSSFPWVNRVSLDDLLGSFRDGRPERRAAGVTSTPPAGFAAWPARKGTRALSADDAMWRVRVLRTKQVADLTFWREALRNRLVETGYTLVSEGDIPAGAGGAPRGARLELSAPDGERDATWVVGLFVDGHRIVVAEAAGESGGYSAHRAAVEAALAQVTP